MNEEIKEPKEYCVFPAIPSTIGEINGEYLIAYCVANKEVKWLKETANKEKEDKNGVVKKYSFLQMRQDFVLKFFPELANKPKPKKPTLYDRIMDL